MFGLKTRLEELKSKLDSLKTSGKSTEIKEKQEQLNRLNTELITVKTRQEQYQTFIDNSLNRKDDIAQKITAIKADMERLQPLVIELKEQKQIKGINKAFIAKDDIEFGFMNTIPLWQFGLTY